MNSTEVDLWGNKTLDEFDFFSAKNKKRKMIWQIKENKIVIDQEISETKMEADNDTNTETQTQHI